MTSSSAAEPSTSPSLEPRRAGAALEGMGAARFHAGQIYRWIHRRGVTDFDTMTDLAASCAPR